MLLLTFDDANVDHQRFAIANDTLGPIENRALDEFVETPTCFVHGPVDRGTPLHAYGSINPARD